MVFKRGDHLRSITEGLAWIESSCKLQGVLKLFDNHVLAQHFFCRLLNSVYCLQLKPMDQIQANYPAIDLGDSTSRVAYQITTERVAAKVQHTLDKFIEHSLDKRYDDLRILVIGERQATYKSVVVPAPLQFDCDRNITGIRELSKYIETLDTERLDELQAIFTEELKHAGASTTLLTRIAATRVTRGAEKLIGREDELKRIDDAALDPKTHILTIVAWGGVGKTSLVVEWMNRNAADNWRGLECVFDWSFYSQSTPEQGTASADLFVAAALNFFGDEDMAKSPTSPWDKGARLAQLIAAKRTLLVLTAWNRCNTRPDL
jgi:hypothetical protein